MQWDTRAWLALALLASCLAGAHARTETRGVPCTKANDCATGKHNIYCEPDAAGSATRRCVQCLADDDCDDGEFCVKAAATLSGAVLAAGQCAPRAYPLGARCDARVTAATVVRGENERLYCGLVTAWEADGRPALAMPQWQGACVDKTCFECLVGTVAGNRVCMTGEIAGAGGRWQTFRSETAGLSQDTQAQLLLVIAVFSAASFALSALALWLQRGRDKSHAHTD